MTKTELIARLQELSKKLGRELSIEGTNDVLEARIREGEAELALLDTPDDEEANSDSADRDAENSSPNPDPADIHPKVDEETNVTRRRIKLYRTLDVWHYKKGADRRNPSKVLRVREIVPEGAEIDVDAAEAADIIREEHGRAL